MTVLDSQVLVLILRPCHVQAPPEISWQDVLTDTAAKQPAIWKPSLH